MHRGVALALFSLAAVACSDEPSTHADAASDAAIVDVGVDGGVFEPDAEVDEDSGVPVQTITATGARHFVQGNLVADVPIDFTNLSFRVLAEVEGGYLEVPGLADGPGRVRFQDVPVGVYYLVQDLPDTKRIYVTSEPIYDLSSFQLGRIDSVIPETSTPIAINATGLAPWQETDELELISPDVGAGAFALVPNATNPPTPGATELSDFRFDYFDAQQPLIDARFGDRAYFIQLTTTSTTDPLVVTARKVLELDDLILREGQTSSVMGAFTDITFEDHAELDWRVTEFDALGAAVSPQATLLYRYCALDALTTAHARGLIGAAPDLALIFPLSTQDLLLDLEFRNLFPDWDQRAIAIDDYFVEYRAEGAQNPARMFAQNRVELPHVRGARTVIAPRVGTVRNPRIDGRDLFAEQVGVGLTPRVTWDAPALGTATSYRVDVALLRNENDNTRVDGVAQIFTARTNLTIPPNLLETGVAAVLRISAKSGPDHSRRASDGALPFGSAEILTAKLRP